MSTHRGVFVLTLFLGLLQQLNAQQLQNKPFWTHGPISTTSDTSIAFGNGARSVRYMVLYNVIFHGPQDGNWLNDGARFDRNGVLFDPDTGCHLATVSNDVVIPVLKLDYCKPVPLWYAVGNQESHQTAVYSADRIEFYEK